MFFVSPHVCSQADTYFMDLSLQYRFDYADNTLHDLEECLAAAGLTLVDIMTLIRENPKASETLATKVGRPVTQCKLFVEAVERLMRSEQQALDLPTCQMSVSTGLSLVDRQIHGGCAIGQVTEVFGASGTGKSQFLMTIAINSQNLKDEHGEPLGCIYISTESPLETRRLVDMAAETSNIDLSNIECIHCSDAENQDHIVFTQLSAKLAKAARAPNRRIGVVILDSVSHHLRASETYLNSVEFLRDHMKQQEQELSEDSTFAQLKVRFDALTNEFIKADKHFRLRTAKEYYLLQFYRHLEFLARTYRVAIIVSNQVSDVVRNEDLDVPDNERCDPLNYDFQVGTVSGWDAPAFVSTDDTCMDRSFSFANTSFMNTLDSANSHVSSSHAQPAFEEQLYNRKRRIPALGYIWAKLVPRKILLWKTYVGDDLQPAKRPCTGHNEETGDKTTRDIADEGSQDYCDSKLGRKTRPLEVKRFARVVSSSVATVGNHAPCSPNNGATVEFIILQSGIKQIT